MNHRVRYKQTFWASAILSINQPIAHKTIPAMSLPVPNAGFEPPREGSETEGEFRIVTGRETIQTYL